MNSIELDSEDIMNDTKIKSNTETLQDTLNQKSGIYKIINKLDGKYYVGSTKDFNKRWLDHKSALIGNRHPNDKLQRAWNKYGQDKFEFVITESTDPTKTILKQVEQKYLNVAKNEQTKCYNLNFESKGGELSEYSIEKIRQKALNRDYVKLTDKYTPEERKQKYGLSKSRNPNWKGGISIKLCKCGKKMDYYSKTCMQCRPPRIKHPSVIPVSNIQLPSQEESNTGPVQSSFEKDHGSLPTLQ
jgi:group I intron endonuclease